MDLFLERSSVPWWQGHLAQSQVQSYSNRNTCWPPLVGCDEFQPKPTWGLTRGEEDGSMMNASLSSWRDPWLNSEKRVKLAAQCKVWVPAATGEVSSQGLSGGRRIKTAKMPLALIRALTKATVCPFRWKHSFESAVFPLPLLWILESCWILCSV
jgi:hypothetical protein